MKRTSLLCSLLLMSAAAGSEPLVFISSFATGDKAAIHAFGFDSSRGSLKTLGRTTDLQNPFFLAISRDKKHLYAIDTPKFGGPENGSVAAYAIEGQGGDLRRLNKASTRGTASCYLSVDATGRTVLVANYATGSVAALPVKGDGSVQEAASFMQHEGSSIDPQRQKGSNAHSIVISPDNRFAFAADLGIDKILIFRLDASKAVLQANEDQSFVKLKPGSGPRHLTFHPNGRFFYAINELANTVTVFDFAAAKGALTEKQTISTLPGGFDGKSYTADVKITPDGRFLYGTNRGHDSIACYRIEEDGTLSLLKIEPSLGKGPQNLMITPDGRWLLCANMPGNSVAVFSIDTASGAIRPNGEKVEVLMPSCILFVE